MSNKKVLDVFNDSSLRNLIEGGHSFFSFCKGDLLKSFENPALNKKL